METEPKSNQRNKRRERAQQLQGKQNVSPQEGSCDEGDGEEAVPKCSKDKGRCKQKKRRDSSNSSLFEEDIIDGFAIMSFKTFEDLEIAVKNTFLNKQNKDVSPEPQTIVNNNNNKNHNSNSRPSTPQNREKKIRKKVKKQINTPSPKPTLSEQEDREEESSLSEDPVVNIISNGPLRSVSGDRLSDASTHSSSGKGYLCDTESGDDRASDAGSDLFTVNHITLNHPVENHIRVPTPTPSPTAPLSIPTCTVTSSSPTCNRVSSPNVPINTVTTSSTTAVTVAIITTTTTATATATTSTTTTVSSTPIPSTTSRPPSPPRRPLVRATSSPTPQVAAPPPPRAHVQPPPPPQPLQPPVAASREIPKVTPPPTRTPRREERERETTLPPSLPFSRPQSWGSSHIYPSGPVHISIQSAVPSLHLPLHSTHNHTPSYTPHPAQPPSLHSHHSAHGGGHGMFAPPLPPGPSPLPSSAMTNPAAALSRDPLNYAHASQEILQRELNSRFLHSHERPASLSTPAMLQTELHQHHHLHQHQHNHQYPLPTPYSSSIVPTPTPHVFDKIPKYDSPFYRGSTVVPSGPQTMLSLRDREKSLPPSNLPPQKKTGKWCAVHVRIAWEIYNQQQKPQPDLKGSESKPSDPLRPPSHLLPTGSLHRPPDMGGGNPASLLGPGSIGRNIFDSTPPHGSFLNPSHLGIPPFPRPSPYPVGTNLSAYPGLAGSSLIGRDIPTIPGVTPPQEWNRLHRTPPSFPTPPAWPKSELEKERERERELEREREKEREREREREKERERERERLAREHERKMDEMRERERKERERLHMESRERYREHERHRSRSRSPIRNGRIEIPGTKLENSYSNHYDDRNSLKIKEERREDHFNHERLNHERKNHERLNHERLNQERLNQERLNHERVNQEREKLHSLRSEYLLSGMPPSSRALGGPFLQVDDRNHTNFWNPFDKRMETHRLDMQRERDQILMSRMHNPLLQLEDPRLKDEMYLREMESQRSRLLDPRSQEYYEKLAILQREKLVYEQNKVHPLRQFDHLSAAHLHHTVSPLLNHTGSKSNSPASIPGAPPPLIPSATQSRSHANSPLSAKSKGCSPSSASDMKDKRDSSSTDPDAHSR